MLTRLIHCVTLVAFSAHVLLGCCAHHHHEDTSALCLHDHGHSHDASHQHGDGAHGCDESDFRELVGSEHTDHPASPPCDHSQECEHWDCTFASSDSRIVPATATVAFLRMPGHAAVSAAVRSVNNVIRFDNLSAGCLLVGHRCALQQSWQI